MTMLPDERVFREHLAGGAFRLGVASGAWRCVSISWPIADIAIAAAARERSPEEYHFRFNLSGYPSQAPTARLWDPKTDGPLAFAEWPTGGIRFKKVFRTDWQGGSCLYLPCDRISMQGHCDWPSAYPAQWWTPKCDITHYLRIVSELLTSVVYTGIAS